MNQLANIQPNLPETWCWKRLDDLGQWGSGGTPRRSVDDYFGGDIPWFKIGDLTDGIVGTSEECLTEKGLEDSAAKIIPPGSLLIAMYGSIGKLGISRVSCTTNQAIAHCLPNDSVAITKYLFWTLLFFRPELINLGKGGTQQNISQTVLKRIRIPVPPVKEQRRIVSEIEELFSNLDAGLESLQMAKRQLERYRLSVLQAAVRGRLTAEWRLAHNPVPADRLLEQILEERRENWEEWYRRERYESKGKEPPSGWRDRYSEPEGPANAGELPQLPSSWVWTSLDELTWNDVDYRGKTPPYSNSGIPTISAGNIKDGRVSFHSREKYVSEETYYEWLTRGVPNAGDLIVTTEAPVGATALFPNDGTYLLTRRVLACQTVSVDNRFLQMCFQTGPTRRHLEKNSRGTTVPRILKKVLFKTPIPLPPLAEQRAITAEVERLDSIGGEAKRTVNAEATRAERLRQSILREALSGGLN